MINDLKEVQEVMEAEGLIAYPDGVWQIGLEVANPDHCSLNAPGTAQTGPSRSPHMRDPASARLVKTLGLFENTLSTPGIVSLDFRHKQLGAAQ